MSRRKDLKSAMDNASLVDEEAVASTEGAILDRIDQITPQPSVPPIDIGSRHAELLSKNTELLAKLEEFAGMINQQEAEIARLKNMFDHAMELAKEARA